MRRFGVFLLWLALGFAAVNWLYLLLMKRIDWNFSKATEAQAFKGKSYEMLILGNSTAMDGVNAELLSQSVGESYNLALGGATLEANWLQLETYLANNERPKRVLLFLSSCHVNYAIQSGVNPMIEPRETGKPGLHQIPLYAFRWLFIENFKKLISRDHRDAAVVRGQLQMRRTVPDTSVPASPGDCPSAPDYLSAGYDYLWKMQQRCLELGIDFLIGEMPCWRRSQNECADYEVASVDRYARIINLNNSMLCDRLLEPGGHWLSENHLNLAGSEALTRHLIALLSKEPDQQPASSIHYPKQPDNP